ncbi:MAG: hypothetical protein HDR48_03500 [Bacteroides sp.]|nr:hypothetical protein [Bacteroides sp.]
MNSIRRSRKSKLLNAFTDCIHKIDPTANIIDFVFEEAKHYDVKGKTYLQSLSKYYLADTGIPY